MERTPKCKWRPTDHRAGVMIGEVHLAEEIPHLETKSRPIGSVLRSFGETPMSCR
jgi:hypothetical protein